MEEGERCTSCEAKASEMLREVCKAVTPVGVDCDAVAKEYDDGKLSIEQFATRVMTLVSRAENPAALERVTAVLRKYTLVEPGGLAK